MTSDDKSKKTKDLLAEVLAELYRRQSSSGHSSGPSYLEAEDGQFLGKITDNKYDRDSILNKYGPYGSRYSATSIFNPYSIYGSKYGAQSINNPYCTIPPKLFVNGTMLGRVSSNKYVPNSIPADSFIYTLTNDISSLMVGRVVASEQEVRAQRGDSYIQANDGAFLGKLTPNEFDSDSIFNKFGPYGSEFSPTSIFNTFSQYGGQFSLLSPFNSFSTTPPKVFLGGQFAGFLTVNEFLNPRIDPNAIEEWAKANVSAF